MDPATALVAAHPERFDAASAEAWVAARRSLLLRRTTPSDGVLSASSGCATRGAHRHAEELAESAAHALARLEAGCATACEACGATLPFDRLDSAPAAVRCTTCCPVSAVDTRWCR